MNNEINTLDQKLPTLSNKYRLAKTTEMIKNIEGLGFKMDKFVALKVRKKERQGFQKHRVIFTSPLLKATTDGVPQLLLTNSHDGSSSVILQLGFFRYVCSNGLVVGSNIIAPVRVRHSGNDFDERLIVAINYIVDQAEILTASIERLKAKRLTSSEIMSFQREALQKRLGNVKIESFYVPSYREEDQEQDLFTVMNVVQENLIRGGARVILEDENGKRTTKSVRRVNSLISQTEINMMLWDLAEQRVA
jgi:hypothetical protein